jgi:hypothetical protein
MMTLMASPVRWYSTSKVAGLALIELLPDTSAMTPYRKRYLQHTMLAAIVVGVSMFAGAEETEEPDAPPHRAIAIVTHLENDVESITRGELARIFLKRQTSWPDGERCIPIDQRGDNEIRREFSGLVLRRTVYEMKRFWMQETMTGNAKPPVSLESAATVKKYLQKIRGAVAYIYLDEVDDTVRILAVTDVKALAQPAQKQAGKTDSSDSLVVGESSGEGLQESRDTNP